MRANKLLVFVGAGLMASLGFATLSPSAEVITTPSSVYWTTLVTSTPQMKCAWPVDATKATLSITGVGFNETKAYTRGETDEVLSISDVTFPTATKHEDEHLYTLVLTFLNKSDKVCKTYTSKLTNFRGGQNAGTRVIVTDDITTSTAWQKVNRSALIPIIEEGLSEVTLNKDTDTAQVVDAGVNGACGWYEWLNMPLGMNTFTMRDNVATFNCLAEGMILIIR